MVKGISDHSPILLKVLNKGGSHSPSFKFINIWADDPGFLAMVEAATRVQITGCSMFKLVSILKHLKKSLKQLNGDVYRNMEEQVAVAKKELHIAQKKVHDQPMDEDCKEHAQTLLSDYLELSEKQMALLKQRAKMNGLVNVIPTLGIFMLS